MSNPQGKVDWRPAGAKLVPVTQEAVSEFKTYSVEEAAKLVGIGRSKAYELVQSGELPAVQFGRLYRIPHAGLLKKVQTETAK
jgi:excisionase family DNA binding protein